MKTFWRFTAQYTLLGVAVAAIVIWLAPTLFGPETLERATRPSLNDVTSAIESSRDSQRSEHESRAAPRPSHGWTQTRAHDDPPGYRAAVARAAPAVVRIFSMQGEANRIDLSQAMPESAIAQSGQSPSTLPRTQLRSPAHTQGEPFSRQTERPRPIEFNGPQDDIATTVGSGVLLDTSGTVLTNHHVIAGAQALAVQTLDGRNLQARIIGSDRDTDLAVLRVDLDDFDAIPIGRSAGLAVGDIVLAIGNPFGFGQTVTQGIVSATGRNRLGINVFEDFIQTDAAVNPGNSGGALVNGLGELVGINTAIFSRSGGSLGIGFAIPIDLALEVAAQIIEHGFVARGWLGIEVQDLTPLLADSLGLPTNTRGVLVAGLLRNGPADRAGLKLADLIVRIDGNPIFDSRDALDSIAARRPGESISLEVLRGTQPLELTAEAAQRPASD
ncbi:MAG: S1C family serine protease [Thioalkalivibrionaceae bacterium]